MSVTFFNRLSKDIHALDQEIRDCLPLCNSYHIFSLPNAGQDLAGKIDSFYPNRLHSHHAIKILLFP